ncbi:MAG TPA: aminoglycoside phosphotransferase family protein [Luteitalea sp.]|nr:aminoglycoside phosphotransferase family protein [Luteitalea sp.]
MNGGEPAPASAPAARPPVSPAERAALALARFAAPDGNAWGLSLTASPIRRVERPFSHLTWYRLDAAGVAADIVLKVARTRTGGRGTVSEADAASDLAKVFAGDPSLGVIAPLQTYPDLGAIITPAIDAPSLGAQIEERARWWPRPETQAILTHGCQLAGQWLRRLHVARPVAVPWSTMQLGEDLRLRMRLLADFPSAYGMPRALAVRLERWLDAHLRVASPTALSVSLTHRDYSPSNMLYDGRVLRVLDLATVGDAPRLLDVTRFLHQIDMLALKPRYRPHMRHRLQDAFRTGYGDDALIETSLVHVFMARHSLSHWLGAARRVRRDRAAVTAWLLCRRHRHALARIVA